MNNKYNSLKQHLQKIGFDINIEFYKELKDMVNHCTKNNDIEGLVEYFKNLQNCGGYALQLPINIYSPTLDNNFSFEERVLRILQLYPFVRLLGNTTLREKEYIVLYRAENVGFGHHFVKIVNNKATQKNNHGLPFDFSEWDDIWESKSEAVFAVRKQEYRTEEEKELPQCTNDFRLDEEFIYLMDENNNRSLYTTKAKKPKSFSSIVKETIKSKKSSFIHRGKKYYLKLKKDNTKIIYICNEKGIIGQIDSDDTIQIDLNKIYCFQPQIPISIKTDIDFLK